MIYLYDAPYIFTLIVSQIKLILPKAFIGGECQTAGDLLEILFLIQLNFFTIQIDFKMWTSCLFRVNYLQ